MPFAVIDIKTVLQKRRVFGISIPSAGDIQVQVPIPVGIEEESVADGIQRIGGDSRDTRSYKSMVFRLQKKNSRMPFAAAGKNIFQPIPVYISLRHTGT